MAELLEPRRLLTNQPPVPVIDAPMEGTHFNAGDIVQYAGGATDPEDGTLSADAFSWTIVFHHDQHTHSFLGPIDGVTSGSFQTATSGEPAPVTWYRIHLTVTDSAGMQGTTFRDVLPNSSIMTFVTSPAGLSIELDGQPQPAPYSVQGVVGFIRNLSAAANQFADGQWYQFDSWSDGGSRAHDIATPASDTTYTVNYVLDTLPPTVESAVFGYDGALLPDPPHWISVTFSEDVSGSLNSGDLALTNTTTNQPVPAGSILLTGWDPATNTATWTFPGFANGILPDGKYAATLEAGGISDPGGRTLAPAAPISFFALRGDANHDGVVNANDFSILATNFGLSGRSYATGDFTYDGVCNANDFSMLATNFGKNLNAPPTALRLSRSGPSVRSPFAPPMMWDRRSDDSTDLPSLLA